MPKWSVDSETTGLDLRHGAQPFFVSMSDESGTSSYYQWPVDPYTRKVTPDKHEINELKTKLAITANWAKFGSETRERHVVVLQNAKFDVRALQTVGVDKWPWSMTRDTLVAGHLLHSQERHDLTYMTMKYLKIPIKSYEDELGRVVKKCRAFVRAKKNIEKYKLGKWRIAKKGLPDMPSCKKETWKFDSWLPKALAIHLEQLEPNDNCEHDWVDDVCRLCKGHINHVVLRDYATVDAIVTLGIHEVQWKKIKQRKLEKIYLHSLEIAPILFGMEQRGMVVNGNNLRELESNYSEKSSELAADCIDIADSLGYELQLPKGGSVNNSLRKVVFEGLKLPPIRGAKSKTDNPSLDKYIMESYILTQPKQSMAGMFCRKLMAKRSLDTALTFIRGYRRFWRPLVIDGTKVENFYVLYPNLNQTGTATTRFSSSNPNEQNISKKENFNLRYCFGPPPGYEMWRLDYENLELRIPAYDSGEQAMIDLFEKSNLPPYFGSNHLLVCHILHKKLFEDCMSCKTCNCEIRAKDSAKKDGKKFCDCGSKREAYIDGRHFKDRYKSTWYSWTKNGNFAVQYGAQVQSGTADRAYHVQGAQAQIQKRLGKINDLNQRMIDMANRLGYIEIMPDKTIDPERGYPLYCTRTGWGTILPTTPLSYRVQGTAGWVARKAMWRCERQLQEWRDTGFDAYMDAQVHDELGFIMPIGGRANLWRVERLKALMELSGDDIGIPLTVDVSYHPNNWSKESELLLTNAS